MCQVARLMGALSHLGLRLSVTAAFPCCPGLPLAQECYPVPVPAPWPSGQGHQIQQVGTRVNMGEGKTRSSQPVARTAHRTNDRPGAMAAAWHRTPRASRTKGCDWPQGADLLLQALSALRAVSCFSGGEKSHLQIFFQSQNLLCPPIKETMGGRGVCASLENLSHRHTRTPASETQAPLSEAQAGAWPAKQGFREHWITTNLSRLSPVRTLRPNSDRPLPDSRLSQMHEKGQRVPTGDRRPRRQGRQKSEPVRKGSHSLLAAVPLALRAWRKIKQNQQGRRE